MMFPSSENKRSNRKAKKKRTLQTKENQSPKNTVTEEKIETMIKPSLDTSVSLSQVVNKASFTPFLDGERCILCHQERPVITRKGGSKGDIMPGSQQLVDKLPLWVCPDCRKKLEEDEQTAGMDTALVNNDMLFQSTLNVGHSFLPEEVPEKDVCNCHVCAGKRYLVPGKTKELQELQFSWFEVKHFVRCVYREAGTTLADDNKLMSGSLDMDRIKRHTERLTLKDPHQLYERLEAQTKEYLAEVRVGLIKFLSSTFSNSPQHAKDCVMTLLDEYQSLCVASDILKPFLANLESSYLGQFQLTWELINKKLFCHEIFHDPIIQSSLPTLLSQLRSCTSISSCGVPIPDKCIQDSQSYIIDRFDAFSQEMSATNTLWQKVKLEKNKKENCINEQNLHERGKNQSENWDYPIENEKDEKGNEFCVCAHCVMSTASFSSGSELNEMSSSLMSPKRSCLSSSSSSSASGSNATYCSRHTNNASTDNDLGNLSSTQLLPTALFLNRFTNSNCALCIREAFHSFCFDPKNATTKCRHYDAQDKASSLSPLSSCEPYEMPPCHSCENHESHEVRCPFQHNSSSPPSPETASSIQSLLLNGSSAVGKCRTPNCTNPVSCAAKQTEWDEDDECCTDEGCEGHEHRGALSPSIIIPGNNVNLEAPPSSPSSVRSNGDGSSCDTPTSRSSLSEDGRSNNGKYCDCCYCEFFGHGAPPVAQTSHNFVEMREKLRLRLKEKEKEKKPMDFSHHPQVLNCSTDSRSVDELLTFINGNPEGQTDEINEIKTNSKAAKRQRQKMKKAAEKGNHVIEADEKGYCLLRPRRNETEERRAFCEEKTRKSLKQKKSGKTQGHFLETHRQNAKNSDKTLNRCVRNDAFTHPVTANHQSTRNDFDEKPTNAPVKQGNVSEGAGHVDRRKKKKDKQCAANEPRRGSANGQERRVFVNGSGQEAGRYVEHTRGARLPVREEAEPRHCGEECPPTKELQTQGKKSKGRKKKKGAFLDDVFLPKENITNGHSCDVDEAEREVEEFKRFCANAGPVGRKMKLPANVSLKNLNLGMKKS